MDALSRVAVVRHNCPDNCLTKSTLSGQSFLREADHPASPQMGSSTAQRSNYQSTQPGQALSLNETSEDEAAIILENVIASRRFLDAPSQSTQPESPAAFNDNNAPHETTQSEYASPNASVATSVRLTPAPPPPTPSYHAVGLNDMSDPSWDSMSSSSSSSSSTPLVKHELFFGKWAPVFTGCNDAGTLDDALEALASDWHEKTKKKDEEATQDTRPRREGEAGRNDQSKRPRNRNQNRQQQKIRRERRDVARESSKIQRAFNRYPRRTVRKVLDEQSPTYTGSVKDAENFLRGTYSQPTPSDDGIRQARSLYDDCNWTCSSDEAMARLGSPPSK